MATPITATQLSRTLGEFLARASQGESFIISRSGRQVALLAPPPRGDAQPAEPEDPETPPGADA